jgi:hypothetical protein
VPPYMPRSRKVAEVLPLLYLPGLPTGDLREALPVPLREDPGDPSSADIARMVKVWGEEYEVFRRRDLWEVHYVSLWVHGMHVKIMRVPEDDRLCLLVMIWARPHGTKELMAREDGYHERKESWATLLRDVKRCGPPRPGATTRKGPPAGSEAPTAPSPRNAVNSLQRDHKKALPPSSTSPPSLESPAQHRHHQKPVPHRAAPATGHQRGGLKNQGPGQRVQAPGHGPATLPAPGRPWAPSAGSRKSQVERRGPRRRGHIRSSGRRPPVTADPQHLTIPQPRPAGIQYSFVLSSRRA